MATRHILVHDYDEIDDEKLWRIATVHAEELLREITPVLDKHPPGPESTKPIDEP